MGQGRQVAVSSLKERRDVIRERAAALQGSKKAGDIWLKTPAIGLDGKVPRDLLRSRRGADLVEELLGRLECGVYS
jgi:putative toxin-antitoxin system antitoxin component (TIGR02293 family)